MGYLSYLYAQYLFEHILSDFQPVFSCLTLYLFQTSVIAYLSSGAGHCIRIPGSAHGAFLNNIILEPKSCCTVDREILVGPPSLPIVLGSFQHHRSWARWLEHSNDMSQVEFCFKVQSDFFPVYSLGRLPPGDGVCKKIVCHVSREMGVIRLVGIAFGAARLPTAMGDLMEEILVWVEAVQFCTVLATRGESDWCPPCCKVSHWRVARTAITAEGL